MLELTFDESELTPVNKQVTTYNGLYEIEMSEYRKADFLANSELQTFTKNPSSYVWSKTAPSDPIKATSADFGTALHTSLLEPELYEDTILVASTKGRTAQAFLDFQKANNDKLCLTDAENNQIKIMSESAKCDPMFKRILDAKGICEASIFVTDPRTGLDLKIRPDKIITACNPPLFCDVKSAASIDEWRNDRTFINPLFNFGYGFTAAYYLYVGSIFYGVELNDYNFLVVSKSAILGKYPVSVFTISKTELIDLGFWDEMLDALDDFAKTKHSDKWCHYEQFPVFNIYKDDSVDVKFSD